MRRITQWMVVVSFALAAVFAATPSPYAQQGDDRLSAEVFAGLEFRSIGPSLTTGRISDLEVDPNNMNKRWNLLRISALQAQLLAWTGNHDEGRRLSRSVTRWAYR